MSGRSLLALRKNKMSRNSPKLRRRRQPFSSSCFKGIKTAVDGQSNPTVMVHFNGLKCSVGVLVDALH
jgi:hypothetical protein